MSKRIKEFFQSFVDNFNKLSIIQKVIILAVFVTIVAFAIFSVSYSTDLEYVYLFKKPLSTKDYGLITAELQKNGELFQTLEDRFILVQDENTGARIRMSLAQNNLLPTDIKGWELFDMESWTTTEFDRNVKLRRAIEGEMKRHIEMLDWVETAQISIAIPPQSLYSDRNTDVSAAVTLQPAEGFYENLKNKKIIRGIQNIVARGIDGINSNNIVITDFSGNQLNNFSDNDYETNIKQAIDENQIKEREIRRLKDKIEVALTGVLGPDRYRVAVDVEANFNRKTIDQKQILPVVIKPKTPGLPYDDSVILENVKVSEKHTAENFEGLGFIPEGPPGQEPNIPPGYKESLDGKNKYSKDEKINNFVNGEQIIKQIDDAMEIEKKSVSVIVDGFWDFALDANGRYVIENNRVKRNYIPISEDDIKKIEELVKGSINFNLARGDKVVVKNIAFDRAEQFRLEDEDLIFRDNLRVYSLYTALSLALLVVAFILLRNLLKLRQKIKQIRQSEQEKIRSIQKDQIISDIEALESEYIKSSEATPFVRLQEEIMAIIREDSKGAARVIKFWLAKGNETSY